MGPGPRRICPRGQRCASLRPPCASDSSELAENPRPVENFTEAPPAGWSTVGPMDVRTVGGRYALDGRLGEGGMGQVYRARHIQLGKAFALKIISPAFANDHVARARFNQEAKLASEISHPNIVSVVDFGEDPQFGAYMVMELVDGEPLITSGALPMSVKRAL